MTSTGAVDAERHAETVAAGGLALSRFLTGADVSDLAVMLACVRALPDGVPERSILAAGLIHAIVRLSPPGRLACVDALGELVDIADRHQPGGGGQWTATRAAARASALAFGVAQGTLDPLDARNALTALAASVAPDDPAAVMIRMAGEAVEFAAAIRSGDVAGMRDMSVLSDVAAAPGAAPMLQPLRDLLSAAQEVVLANEAGDDERRRAAFSRMREVSDLLPPDSDVRRVAEEGFAAFDVMRGMESGQAPTAEQVARLDATARDAGPGDQQILGLLTAGMAELGVGADVPRERIDAAVARLRATVAQIPDGSSLAPFALLTLGMALMRRYEVTREAADLVEMSDLLTAARDRSATPDAKVWGLASQLLALVTDRIGDPVAARRLMVTGLRGFAWSVLLQTDVAAAATVARDAASAAMDAAEHCLRDDAVADAVAALDAGRGLTLFAAVEIRDVATRLDAIDRADLAGRWRTAMSIDGQRVPLDLRQAVLTALSQAESGRLLDPPAVPEIQAAVSTLDADALVYLVPARGTMHGAAVVVPAGGPPRWTVLPELVLGGGGDVDRYLGAMAARSAAGPRDLASVGEGALPPTDAALRANLDRLCDWAWRAAVGPVLDLVARSAPVPAHRPWRLVLVPMGDLARVPWHAARRPDTGTRAVQAAAFSYAASARMLCESARRGRVPVSTLGLIVGDPDAGPDVPALRAARAEAYAVRETYYRAARYVGRRPDESTSPSGEGRRDEVVDWLTSRRPGAGAMLHLACHGVTRSGADDASSYLLLAHGETLTAEELVGLLADHRHRDIALVVLAACRSGVSTLGYDEAYSLGTTFLAAGVRTVLSTQWSIPDVATSLLMFMFHHHLRAGSPAWDALRRAQIWMLDPARRPPDEMPDQLRDQLRTTEPADVLAWAGFVHLGQ